jgi:hypothetical protein
MFMAVLLYFYECWQGIPTRHRSAIVDRASLNLHPTETSRANVGEELLTSTLDVFLCVSNVIKV